jgi:hypothetical protein
MASWVMVACDLSLCCYTRAMPRLAHALRAFGLGLLALSAGCVIAAIDTRPGWDDTGVTAGLLFLAAGFAAFAGVPGWLTPVLVAGPLVIAELRGLGWGALLVCAIAAAGALAGFAARRTMRRASA